MVCILAVDDDPSVRRKIRSVLEIAGYDVLEARNGRECEHVVASKVPDAVILDLLMPEQEGIETILALRRRHADIKVLAMSAGNQREAHYLELACHLGADGKLTKPFSAEALLAAMRSLLSN